MTIAKYVVYYRVSTKRQGRSGLGLEAQERDVQIFLEQFSDKPYDVLQTFTEIESGKNDDREQLQAAIALCKKQKATLLVAKLDRLSRDVEFIAGIIKRCDVKMASMPNADRFQVHIYAALGEQERLFISERTKQALQSAKARGVKLGGLRDTTMQRNIAKKASAEAFASRYKGLLASLVAEGNSQRKIAQKLNEAGCQTAQGANFTAVQVGRMIKRLNIA